MDQILYWNNAALEADRVAHTDGLDTGALGPVLSSRALSIVHLAMYDAFAGTTNNPGSFPTYLPGLPAAPAGASIDAAIAAAAHAALSALYPSQKAFFDAQHLNAGLQGPGIDQGQAFGLLVAQRMLADRRSDPSVSDSGYSISVARGAHRQDPDNAGQGVYAPFYGANSKAFAVSNRPSLDAPPEVGTGDYLTALREVRGKGIAPELTGALPSNLPRRSVEETLIGLFWAYDGASGLGTPPRLYNQIVRTIAVARKNTLADNARLFAFVNVAMGDAGIFAWQEKFRYDFWRPVLGIREHDRSNGPAGQGDGDFSGDCDIDWLPLGAPASNSTRKNFTPPFPAYPSGHATFGAAALQVTRLFYGISKPGPDELTKGLQFVSDEFNGVTRDNMGTVRPRHARVFRGGLWEMIEENGRSRVNLGVHWVFDAFAVDRNGKMDLSKNIGGVPLGLAIAQDIFNTGNGKAPKKSNV